jgi:hypothetical protein
MIHENEGIIYTVPLSGQHLEHLLNSIATLYANNDLGLSLNLEYWCSTAGDSSNERYPARQVSALICYLYVVVLTYCWLVLFICP